VGTPPSLCPPPRPRRVSPLAVSGCARVAGCAEAVLDQLSTIQMLDAYSGDLGRPVRRDDGPAFRRKPAGAERRWAFRYLSQAGGGVKATRVFRSEPPVSVS
jgi:hypothetical protein